MKTQLKISTLLLGFALMSFTPNQSDNRTRKPLTLAFTKTSIQWKNSEVNLGEITQNKPVNLEFEFTNTGDAPVLILSVKAACGCTATDYSRTPVLPGESTKIKATFNAASKGAFNKYLTVTTNAEEAPKTLSFTGTVI